ncbi:hypothetical protein ACWGQ5_41000 [Streptomyces sp. NPDC055722]
MRTLQESRSYVTSQQSAQRRKKPLATDPGTQRGSGELTGCRTIEPVDLLVANLIVEYVGVEEFVAFAAANARSIDVLSCVIQRNDAAGFVSSTDHSSSFDGLVSVSSDIDPETLTSAMSDAGFVALGRCEYPLPSGKALVRQDFQTIPLP